MIINDRQIIISSAGSRRATHWPAQTLYWSEFIEKLRIPVRGTETLAEYLRLTKGKQDDLKDVGGFVGGSLEGNRRKGNNVIGRDIITLDLDSIQPGQTGEILKRLDALGCAYAVYSTRKHEEVKPRLRVIVPLNRTVTADEYEPLARKLGQIIGIDLCDPTTFQASRLMYWPSCSSDSNYIYQYGDKSFLDADGVLAMYSDWRNVAEWPEVPGVQQPHVKLAAKQGNPTEKPGVVGAFCRIYDVYKAMDTFLPGEYTSCDMDDRLTFTGGSTTGGAIVYDNGNFLYSHHATDPAGGKLCNAFDLVRYHKFSELDDDVKDGTPINKVPSYMAMCEFAVKDTYVAALLNQERYEKATQEFEGVEVGSVEDNINWISKLESNTSTGTPLKTIRNIRIIMANDPMLKNKIAYNELTFRVVCKSPLPWQDAKKFTEDQPWGNADESGLRDYLQTAYKIISPNMIEDSFKLTIENNKFHPVQDYLYLLKWDGIARVESIFINYLGAEDNLYNRMITRKWFTAAVARAIQPGCKFDYMIVLVGPQGAGKSFILSKLGMQWYSDCLTTMQGKEAAEQLIGVWIMEVGELSAQRKAENEVIKRFITSTEDKHRLAYNKHVKYMPRTVVFAGTTNDKEFLNDYTGNRRYWPLDVAIYDPPLDMFTLLDQHTINQIWAEAKVLYDKGETLYLNKEETELVATHQESHREVNSLEGIIMEFINRLIPLEWETKDLSERIMYWNSEFKRIKNDNLSLKQRNKICAIEIWCECLGGFKNNFTKNNAREINSILHNIPNWTKTKTPRDFGCYGNQRGFENVAIVIE